MLKNLVNPKKSSNFARFFGVLALGADCQKDILIINLLTIN